MYLLFSQNGTLEDNTELHGRTWGENIVTVTAIGLILTVTAAVLLVVGSVLSMHVNGKYASLSIGSYGVLTNY